MAIATAQWLQGEAALRLDRNDRAAGLIDSALATVVRLNPGSALHGEILLSRGGVHGTRAELGAALADYQAAHNIFRKLGDLRNRAKSLMLIAMLYSDGNDSESSLKYLSQALEVYRGDPGMLVAIYNNRASNFQELGRHAEAEAQYRKALALAEQIKSPLLQARIQGNIARVLLKAHKIAAAAQALAASQRLAKASETAVWQVQLLPIAAGVALQQGNLPRALALISQRFAGVDLTTTGLSSREGHQVAYAIYKALDRPVDALAHLEAQKRLDDQATAIATNVSTALLAARFDFANQELKISKLRADELERSVRYEQDQAKTERLMFIGAIAAVSIIIGLLALGLVTIRRSRDKVRAANDDLAITNAALGKALAAKTEFLATTSHEIRTPLNGILGMTEVMLADSRLTPDLRDRLGIVRGAGATMRALVDDILDIAKMETGNLTIEFAPFDLCATVTDAAQMWEEQARSKGLSFTLDMTDCPARIMGDAARVRQIVFNLLSNALKFTRVGAVTVALRTGEDRLWLDVSDSGIGIPANKLDEIFESFRQADAGTTRQFGGTGLGLSICRNLARAMNGDVTVTSREGQGATFTLSLPLVHAEAIALGDLGADQGTGAATLIIDRNPIMRSMFRTLVTPHCDIVLTAASIDEAVTLLAQTVVANIVIDDATLRAGGDPGLALEQLTRAAGDAATTLLWPADRLDDPTLLTPAITRIVAKPVSGAALVEAIFASPVVKNNAIPDLVSRAA
ncbi:ATP-binding response regulator [Sphingomonas sp. CFBP 8764]|uniref:ATP-binding response regulator n=1 Tax=Sphingomonas sp. CFBP 8764 TaxID=2775275 RepID=UPI001FD1E5C7|nr:ATP-binding protein [Sphingomonas sp. CFBP 8764]